MTTNPTTERIAPASLGPVTMEHRRRRALYRATHRGTKELDWLIGRYVEAHLPQLSEDGMELMELMERFLTVPDPELHAWIMAPRQLDQNQFREIVAGIRAFHKMAD